VCVAKLCRNSNRLILAASESSENIARVSTQLGTRDLIGYAQVSTDEQNLDLQLDALKAAGCKRVFRDVGSGSLKHRPQLDACFDYLRTGDTLVVWRRDRLGRGLKHLIESIDGLHAREVGFRSLTETIDHHDAGGPSAVPHLWRASRVRARAHPRRSGGGAGPWSAWWAPVVGQRGEASRRRGDARTPTSDAGDRCRTGRQPSNPLPLSG
jgi:hypothetical protein